MLRLNLKGIGRAKAVTEPIFSIGSRSFLQDFSEFSKIRRVPNYLGSGAPASAESWWKCQGEVIHKSSDWLLFVRDSNLYDVAASSSLSREYSELDDSVLYELPQRLSESVSIPRISVDLTTSNLEGPHHVREATPASVIKREPPSHVILDECICEKVRNGRIRKGPSGVRGRYTFDFAMIPNNDLQRVRFVDSSVPILVEVEYSGTQGKRSFHLRLEDKAQLFSLRRLQ